MIIEPAKFERDFNDLIDFQMDMAHESEGLKLDRDTLSKGVKAVFDDPTKGTYYVALDQAKAVASLLTMHEWSDWRNANVLWIHSVYVKPDYRRQGIYRRMYHHLKEMVDQSPDYRGIRLYVDKSNHSAIKTYQKLEMSNEHYDLFEYLQN
jgi:ribosomal protein S18 acetylase RimI-like enzyme